MKKMKLNENELQMVIGAGLKAAQIKAIAIRHWASSGKVAFAALQNGTKIRIEWSPGHYAGTSFTARWIDEGYMVIEIS